MNTSTTINVIKWISVIGGAIAGLFGAWDDALTYLLVLNAVDFASGLVCAFRGKSHKTESGGVSSGVVFDGVARKAYMWLIVLLAAALVVLSATAPRCRSARQRRFSISQTKRSQSSKTRRSSISPFRSLSAKRLKCCLKSPEAVKT